jgi:hypothetical protein
MIAVHTILLVAATVGTSVVPPDGTQFADVQRVDTDVTKIAKNLQPTRLDRWLVGIHKYQLSLLVERVHSPG